MTAIPRDPPTLESTAVGAGRANTTAGPRTEASQALEWERIDPLLACALAEDRGTGDVTSETAVPEAARARARAMAKQAGVLAGIEVFARVFRACDPSARVELLARDGARIEVGNELARIEGNARALLLAERTALNLLQHMSGIATKTARMVALAAGRVRVLDTRKTAPGLRVLEKYAVRCGGGENHRAGLWDEVLLKENHIALAGRPLREVLREQRALLGPRMRITAEARTPEEASAAIEGGANVVLLDNMSPEELQRLGPILRERARALGRTVELEASGGIDETNLERIAATGVDRVSIGALTHTVAALDLALYLEPLP
jgi:nicotinate-nucleotide pyrophosphorylase (carboxylating)